ncbi:alpha-L-rhamnosidase-related protein [Cohnella fermenti]|uniref:Sugar hydrolase n=1 Tax=Cohnella fermenti TaxID=2565925 RepID=A0A4V3WFH5_9BACL|nr:family 78 glycoside hydrolase catalytic domain [Cohnella fermenti]THF80340.1 sugar hydrolase [Cohnella fermenti]
MNDSHSYAETAEQHIPALRRTRIEPKRLVRVLPDEQAFQGWRTEHGGTIDAFASGDYAKGDSIVLDFGIHCVGYLTVRIGAAVGPADAPVRLKLIFGEMPCEIGEDFDSYDGSLSRAWLQEEIVNLDTVPGTYTLPRRYTFRYLRIVVLEPSRKFRITFPDIYVTHVTSGDPGRVEPLPESLPADLREMDRIAVKTLEDCMQTVFEDGPKRDRRLWLGDLRLQALASCRTFGSHSLVKRCLYLFAGLRLEGGKVPACVYEKPEPHPDDIYLYDYALFFAAALHDYYRETGDGQTLAELYPVACDQIRIGLERLDERGIVQDDETWYCFTDWRDELNKQASAQAVLIYCMKRALALARALNRNDDCNWLETEIERASKAALAELWRADAGFFVSGAEEQVSWASQIWMALAGVLDPVETTALMDRLFERPPGVGMTTPYMHHHLIEALFECGRRERAIAEMRRYWGGMMADGADTFWELYDPADKLSSPYGSNLVNSYCHAWSCTPAYFIRTYLI